MTTAALLRPDSDSPWTYIRIHPAKVRQFISDFKKIEQALPANAFVPNCFVHQSAVYRLDKGSKEPQPESIITPIGLIFLQGEIGQTKAFLEEHYAQYHLINDVATGHTATITARQMEPFRTAVELAPDTITYLNDPISHFSGHKRIRILSGILKGQTGYYVRYRRDRKLVVGLAGITIAYGGIHNEAFEFVE